jgi:ubiquinone/menaquinone biosynthesis C-methylase UbiE
MNSKMVKNKNVDYEVVRDFTYEWAQFDQSALCDAERQMMFDNYFKIFPWDKLSKSSIGFDAGCGTGRWAVLAAPRVGHLHCVDPSSAIDIAMEVLKIKGIQNCSFHKVSIDEMPFADDSMDFGYSLGVLHHIPDTEQGIKDCVRKLKNGAPLLLYLYYAFDNQPKWFRQVWKISDNLRRFISKLPYGRKYLLTQLISLTVYFPLARTAKVLEKFGVPVHSFPLSAYRHKSFYSMQTDALDRFGTKLERRFTRLQIQTMMKNAGLKNIQFSADNPFWCAVGYKK